MDKKCSKSPFMHSLLVRGLLYEFLPLRLSQSSTSLNIKQNKNRNETKQTSKITHPIAAKEGAYSLIWNIYKEFLITWVVLWGKSLPKRLTYYKENNIFSAHSSFYFKLIYNSHISFLMVTHVIKILELADRMYIIC